MYRSRGTWVQHPRIHVRELGLDKDYIKNALGAQGQHLAVYYYPPCPEPELEYGLSGHSDPKALTILLQDLQVSGLQVLKDGKWLAIHPPPNAFVINLGDQLQVTPFLFSNANLIFSLLFDKS